MRLPEPRVATFVLLLPVLAIVGGCSNTDPIPVCDDCEKWDRISPVLGRHPSPHPLDPAFVLFSTVQKADSTASDAARQDDEDIWLTWIEDLDDEDANAVVGRSLFAITDDDFGTSGANTTPRWSPSGTQLAWVHSPAPGGHQIWTMGIQVPASRGEAPVLGPAALLVEDARDPAWLTENLLLFSRENKLYRIDLFTGNGTEEQISFDPPTYSSTDKYIDRHPYVASDGGAVFGTRARFPVGDIYVEAFEVLPDGERIETDAFLSFQSPAASNPTFPVLEGGDALRTPVVMRSLPIDSDGPFLIGVSLAQTVTEDSLRESYCDTTIVVPTPLQPDTADTVSVDFDIVRGTLSLVTESTNATVFWTRADGRVSINDFGGTRPIDRCQRRNFDCLLPWAIDSDDNILVGVPETYTVTATFQGNQEIHDVTLTPGDTTVVVLFDRPDFSCDAPEPRAPDRASVTAPEPRRVEGPGAGSLLRAEGDRSNLWRVFFDANGEARFQELVGSQGLIQSPAVTRNYAGDVRYVAWVSDESGDWQLYVQRLVNWGLRGDPHPVRLPGTLDNLACDRNVFHPYWIDESTPGALRLVVTMTECPDNEFPDVGFDQDPWPIGELRIWTVRIDDYQ